MRKIRLSKLFNEFLQSNINNTFTTSTIFSELVEKRPKTKKHVVQSYLSSAAKKGIIEPTGWVTANGNRKQREYKVIGKPATMEKAKPPETIPTKPPAVSEDEVDAIRLGKIFSVYIRALEKTVNQMEADLREKEMGKNAVRGLQKENAKLHAEIKDLNQQLTAKVAKREVRELANENERLKKQIDQQNKELAEIRRLKQTKFKLSDVATYKR